jgi:hypothetical protein
MVRLQKAQQRAPVVVAPQAPGTAAPKAIDDPAFEAAVRDVVERAERERLHEMQGHTVHLWGDKLAEKAELNDTQKAKAIEIATELQEKIRELRSPDGGLPPNRELGPKRDELREQAEKRLADVLSTKQMQVYRDSPELRIDSPGRFRRNRNQ